MAPRILTSTDPLTDDQIDETLARYPPLPDEVLILIRHLADRIATLEEAP